MIKADLNLLRVFDILMELRSVSRAADRLGLTQSAVSHALARLRAQIDDPLFVRAAGGLRPTQRASDLAPGIREGLARLHDAISRVDFDPATTTRRFTISASSYFHLILLPSVVDRFRREAPQAELRILAPAIDLVAGFDAGSLDLALGSFGLHPASLTRTALFTDDFVWVGRAGSDARDLPSRPRLSIARPLFGSDHDEAPRDGIERGSGSPFPLDGSVVTVHDLLAAEPLVAASDLVTLWPRQHLAARGGGLAMLAASDHPRLQFSALWPSRLAADAAHRWLRALIVDAAS